MNREPADNIGGVNIRPSARRGIHSHHIDGGNTNIMGRYGLHLANTRTIHNNTQPTLSQDDGCDEVDNVMSKFARSSSPIPVRRNNIYRRNSCDINNENSEDDSEDNILSKSSPAAFSLYSDEFFTSANSTLEQNDYQNRRHASRMAVQDISQEIQRRIELTTNNLHSPKSREKLHNEGNILTQLIPQTLFLLLLICIAVFYGVYSNEEIKQNSFYDKISFYNDVKELGIKYKVKDTSILQVRTGVATIFDKQDTGSFIFAYNGNDNNFNPMKFNNFVEDVAATASKYLRNDSETVSLVVVDTLDLKMQSEKEFMNEYEAVVAKTGVMLVKDVDNVPSHLAMAFHYYCDEYSPLVRRSAIFFTLNLAKCSNNSDPQSTHEYIEKCLAKKWNSVGEDKIGPLLTRVVNIVIDVSNLN